MALRTMLRVVTLAAAAALLAGCAEGPAAPSPIRLGWVGELPPLDPAARETVGAFTLLSQVHPSLLRMEPGTPEPVLELAESAEFTGEGEFIVELPVGAEFANGHDLTSSDVMFSIQRQVDLQENSGAGELLAMLDSMEAPDDRTVIFRLRSDVHTGFPYVLAGPIGLIVDEETFFADAITPDEDIIGAEAFGGPFTVQQSRTGDLSLVPFSGHSGAETAGATVELRPGPADELGARLQDDSLDVLTGRLPADVLDELRADDSLRFVRAASGRVRLLTFDFARMPFGTRSDEADAAKASAVRHAIADLVDRAALVDELGVNRVAPLSGYLPTGFHGAATPLDELQGDGEGGPDSERAATTLAGAGIDEPVELRIHVLPESRDGLPQEEAALLERQLEAGALFTVELIEVDAEGLAQARADGKVGILLTSLLPGNADPAGYLRPFASGGVLAPGFSDDTVDSLLVRQAGETDPQVRAATLVELQRAIAESLPAIPLTQNQRVLFTRSGVDGAEIADGLALDFSMLHR